MLDKTPPSAPKVNPVTNKSTAVKGKAEANAAIIVKSGKKTIGTGKADKKALFCQIKNKGKHRLAVTAKIKPAI
ncbi:Ig-like domain-containing protein, partial [Bacillus licheniformis]|nr:Ig-like domain-containing protein [Bacillus licheniformis]